MNIFSNLFNKKPSSPEVDKNWKYVNAFNGWKIYSVVSDSEELLIEGLNVWDYKWQNTGETIKVKDPLYGQEFVFPIYTISEKKIEFATAEFSNCIWGFFRKEFPNEV
jgi:hypothetical protein